MLDELQQPTVVDGVEEPTDVRIEHPAHLPAHEPDIERIQRIVLAATWSESVREAEKFLLVDCIQHLDDRPLDDLVLQRGDAERPKPPVRLRDECSARRLCSVRPSMQSRVELSEVLLELHLVLLPRHTVDPSGRRLLQSEERAPKQIDADVMK